MPDVELKLLSSLVKVFPRQTPVKRQEKEWLSALRGETVSFQAAYLLKNDAGRSRGSIEVIVLPEEETKTPTGIELSLRRVRYIQGDITPNFKTDRGYIRTTDGLYPDLLEPFDTNELPLIPGIRQSIWISVTVTAEAAAGRYSIRVYIKSPEGEVLAADETCIDVIPIKLPPLDIRHTRWFHTDCLANYYNVEVFSEAHWEIIENFAAFAVKHGINTILTPIHTPPLDTEIGGERLTTQLIDVSVENKEYTFGFEDLERWVAMCKRIGIEYFEIAHLFTQWGAKNAPKIIGIKDGIYTRLFGWETDATSVEYANYLSQMLPALTGKLNEWGIAEKTIFHISDEPDIKHIKAYKKARQIVEPFLKGFKIIDALTDYELFKQGVVSTPIPAVDHIEPFLEGNVPDLWCYYCCAQSYLVPNQFFMQPSYRNRILGILLYKYDIKGFLHWGYNFYNSVHSSYPINPYMTTDADGAFPSGDAFLVYPGPNGQPLASLRLLVAQEAFNDLRALKLLETLSGREAVLKLIDEDLTTPITFSKFPQNAEYLINLRNKINSKIKKHI